jgi:hypothetical protein
MNTSKLNPVPLRQASLCMDCEMITAAHTRCSVCGSVALLNVAKVLNGDEYADPLQTGLAPMASATARRMRQNRILYHADARTPMNQRPIGELVTFPQTRPSITDENRTDPNSWVGSFREVAAIVQRAMTVAVFALLMLGVNAKGH